MSNNLRSYKQGFSLIELSIAMAIIAILASSIVPIAIRSLQIRAGEKTALEMAMIQEASRNYYIDHKAWPADIPTLQAQGYLNPNWTALNPWHNAYQISSTNLALTVSTDVPAQWANLVASHLPAAIVNNANVSSTLSSPGGSGLQPGVIVAWSGSIANIPAGWALCDGTNGTPDLRDKFIVGVRQDDAGISKSNIMGTLLQTGGSTTHNHGGQTGSHTLTIAEIPPHDHAENYWVSMDLSNSIGLYGNSPGGHAGMFNPRPRTEMTGGGQGHTHTISSDYNVPPFYALAFIMKL
ncbi:MAG: tail fiber protein [Candidatus Omnitrophica bacterium]|nr:tail fiber protein [Candidatus Omnitrophota bacterium]